MAVNGVPAQLSGTSFQAVVPLVEGDNPVTAVAATASGFAGVGAVTVVLDTTPPRLSLNFPPILSYSTTAASVTLTGMINDIVIGTVNDQQATVMVNGNNVTVGNRRFVAPDRPLILGDNFFSIIGRDRTGNNTTLNLLVRRLPVTSPELRMTAGNNQTGMVRARLAQPVVVTLFDAAGSPQPNREVVAKVVEADGSIGTAGAISTFVNGGLVRSVVNSPWLKSESGRNADSRRFCGDTKWSTSR